MNCYEKVKILSVYHHGLSHFSFFIFFTVKIMFCPLKQNVNSSLEVKKSHNIIRSPSLIVTFSI